MSAWDREIEQVGRDYNEGLIDLREYNRRIQEINRDYRDAAKEAASEAYLRELENW